MGLNRDRTILISIPPTPLCHMPLYHRVLTNHSHNLDFQTRRTARSVGDHQARTIQQDLWDTEIGHKASY